MLLSYEGEGRAEGALRTTYGSRGQCEAAKILWGSPAEKTSK
jgi:hypothetical protein